MDSLAETQALNLAAADGWRDAWLRDRGGLAALAAPAWAVAAFVWLAGGVAGTVTVALIATPALLAGVYAAGRAAGCHELGPARRRAWRYLAWALAAALAAAAANAAFGSSDHDGPAALAGAVRLLFYPLAGAACLWFIRSAAADMPRHRFWLDAAIVLLSAGALLWFLVLAPSLGGAGWQAGAGVPPALFATFDAVLCLLAAMVLLGRAGRRRSSATVWLGVALVSLLAADLPSAQPRLLAGPLAWLAAHGLPPFAYAMLAVAAHADQARAIALDAPERAAAGPTHEPSLLPFAGLLLAMAALVYFQLDAWREPGGALAMVVCAAGILVLVRQLLATQDIADSRARAASREAESRFAALVSNSSDVIAITGDDGRIQFATPSAERVFGLRADDLAGRRVTELVALEHRAPLQEFFARSLVARGATATIELKVPRGADRHRIIEVVGANLMHEPAVRGHVLNIRDITDRKGLEDRVKRLAFHDPLTLLANRALFRDRVEHALAVARRRGNRVAAIFVDLDDFKKINDSLGHGEGDRVLRTTAQRLSKCTRAGDTVARLGGDEFAVLVEDATDREQALEVARRIVSSVGEPTLCSGSSLSVGASVGVAFAEDGEGVEELLRNADVAMYHAKAQGRNRYAVFEAPMQHAVRDRLRVETDLSKAISRNELRVLYQPIVDLKSGYLLGVEALVRWQHPERGLIAPAEFIAVAEETGQVVGLGRWVLLEACREMRHWQKRMPLGRQLRLAVNFSAQQLQGADLIADVQAALETSGLDPACLVVEMTESVLMQDTEATLARLTRLKKLGVRIAIDDFGTGYSSLSYLHRFPLDILKIDRSFVSRLGEQKGGRELARAIITLGETLGLEVIAEGIEYEHQKRELLELGCVAGQGYYYSRPALLQEIEFSHQMRLRESYSSELPPETQFTATGRFRLVRRQNQAADLESTDSIAL